MFLLLSSMACNDIHCSLCFPLKNIQAFVLKTFSYICKLVYQRVRKFNLKLVGFVTNMAQPLYIYVYIPIWDAILLCQTIFYVRDFVVALELHVQMILLSFV